MDEDNNRYGDFYLSFYKQATVQFNWDRLHKA